MACLFKRNGKGPWRIAYFDWDPKTGRKRRREVSTRQGDKAIAEQIAGRLEAKARQHKREADDLAELRRRGLSDPVAERLADQGRTTLGVHLDAFKIVLEGKGDTAKHVAVTLSDCLCILDACGFALPADLDSVKVSKWVTEQRKALAPRTINRKLGAFKSFSRWLWETERIRTDPMVQVHKLNGQADRRVRRRALDDDEIARLLCAAEQGPDVSGMTGPDRAMLYRVALGNARPWIPERDTAGRVLDFHALRVTFITRLARCGVAPAVAKTLARHSTITLTMDHYAAVNDVDGREAINRLPDLPEAAAARKEAQRATGTHG